MRGGSIDISEARPLGPDRSRLERRPEQDRAARIRQLDHEGRAGRIDLRVGGHQEEAPMHRQYATSGHRLDPRGVVTDWSCTDVLTRVEREGRAARVAAAQQVAVITALPVVRLHHAITAVRTVRPAL